MIDEQTATQPAWLTEADEDMANQQSDFADIEKALYVLELTDASRYAEDVNGDLRVDLELTIRDKDENGDSQKFDNRKVFQNSTALEGESFKYLMKRLMWAWVKRNPDKIAFLSVLPDNQQAWEDYLTACTDAELTAIANVKPKKKTQSEIEAGYNTKYDVYVSANQTADQPEEGQPAI